MAVLVPRRLLDDHVEHEGQAGEESRGAESFHEGRPRARGRRPLDLYNSGSRGAFPAARVISAAGFAGNYPRAALTRSGVSGSSRTRAPVACATALAIAAAAGPWLASPAPSGFSSGRS